MPLPKDMTRKTGYTVKDIYELPEGKRAELIDGHIYDMAPPSRSHQELVMELSALIHAHIKSKGGSCKIYPAPFAVFLNQDDRTYVEPDLCVICDPDKLDEKGCWGAPDWVIEIVSPSSTLMDNHMKLFKYLSAGVREYWIVDPAKDRITIHEFQHEGYREYHFSDIVKAGIFADLEIDFSKISF